MTEPYVSTIADSFGDDNAAGAQLGADLSATNEAIKDRQAMRRLVRSGVLAPDQLSDQPRILSPLLSVESAPLPLREAARTGRWSVRGPGLVG